MPAHCFHISIRITIAEIRQFYYHLITTMGILILMRLYLHDDVIKWKHFLGKLAICALNSPVLGEFPTQSPVTLSLMVSLICIWINDWVNNREAGDLRRYPAHYDVIVMFTLKWVPGSCWFMEVKYGCVLPRPHSTVQWQGFHICMETKQTHTLVLDLFPKVPW